MAMSRYNQYDPYETHDTNKNYNSCNNERLEKLEKEICCLRTDFDKLKYEQAIAEAAIGRAIIRGSASLGGCLIIPGQNDQENGKNIDDTPINTSFNPKSLKAQHTFGQSFEPTEKSKKNEKEDGGLFTLG